MIKFREKDYSVKPIVKSVRLVNSIKDKTRVAASNAGVKIGNTLLRRNNPVKFKPKTSRQLTREAINQVDRASSGIMRTLTTPVSQGINSGITGMISNPIATTSNIVGKAILPVPGIPAAVKAAPIGAVGISAEGVLRKKIPQYKKLTTKGKEMWKRSRLSQKLQKANSPSLFEMMSSAQNMIPI